MLVCLESDKQARVRKLFLQLRDNPHVGDQIRYKFFREKRIDEKRYIISSMMILL